MGNIAIHKVNELPAMARSVIEQVLGRALEPDEEVSIMACSPHPAPRSEVRKQLARQLENRIARTAERTADLSEAEQEAAIDEAVSHVRANPK